MNKITNSMVSKRHKRKRLTLLRAVTMTMFMALFTQFAQAQVSTGDNYQVYMKEGNSTVARGATQVMFYDDHGPSYASDGNINYWDRWYATEKHYTYVFRPKTEGDKIKVTFKKFHTYEWSDTEPNNCHDIGEFSLRINDDVLKVYNSDGAIAANLIAELTGTVVDEFTFMADGPMTFEFISNDQYREEGWGAQVTAVTSMTVQAPLIRRETCSDDILLVPTVPGATLYYTTNGTTPTTSSTQYTGPIEWPAGNSITIKAIAVLNGTSSSVTTKVFQDKTVDEESNIIWNDRMPTMEGKEPTLERVAGTNKVRITCPAVPTGLNETFYVSYTTNNTLPTATNGNKIFFVPGSSYQYPTSLGITVNYSNTYEIECTTPGTVIRARTFGYSCTNLESAEGTSVTINTVYVDEPTISFETTNNTTGDGETTIGNIMTGATVYYTTDGSTPTTSSTPYNGSFAVTPGQTVKAIAVAGTGYENSPVVSATYIPGGDGQSGTYGSVVVLDDREPHTWSYYSDGDQPIHRLEPRDIKITYFGNGQENNNMTTTDTDDTPTSFGAKATGVAVNIDAPENQFIYLKTLEAANEDGSGDYPYTMIPNPFQVRPVFENGGGTTTETIQVVNGSGSNSYAPMYTNYANYGFKSEYIIPTSYFTTAGISSGDKLTSITLYQASTGSWTATSLTIRLLNSSTGSYGSSTGFVANTGTVVYTNASYSSGSQPTHTFQFDTPFEYTGSNLVIQISSGHRGTASQTTWYGISSTSGNRQSYYAHYASNTATNYTNDGRQRFLPKTTFTVEKGSSSSNNYRGFYAWRVKSLSDGLTIQRANGNAVNVGGIIDPEEEIKFATSKEEGNEVEFEALWAKAYVTTTGSLSGYVDPSVKSARERNFFVLNDGSTWNINGVTIPATYTAYLPNGTNGNTSTSITTAITCSADMKLENIKISAVASIDAAGYNLAIGRGVTNGSSNVASVVYGYLDPTGNASGTSNAFNLRIESGKYTNAYLFYRSENYVTQVTSANHWKMILGSDYDRAKKEDEKLIIAGEVAVSTQVSCSSASARIDVNALSGTFGTTSANTEFYMGYVNNYENYSCQAPRFLEVLGGNFLGGLSGGIERGVSAETNVLTMRIKGGTIHQYLYGSGQHSESYGTRKTIITGGTFDSWLAGGCYGTYNDGGATDGNTYVYFGGDAKQTNTDGIFGAGYGTGATSYNSYTVRKSFVVIADDATTTGSVYGGGNNGYNTSDAEVWLLGGGNNGMTVSGSVFGGANKSKSQGKTTVTMKNGTVNGSLYGGANDSGEVAGLATISISGGTVTNVFGGGKGSGTNMAAGTTVNISNGTINNNVYGGSELGTITGGETQIVISGGTMKDVFGAGKGGSSTAPVYGNTNVTVTGGTVANVYGGGEAGNIETEIPAIPAQTLSYGFEDGTSQGWTYVDNDGDNSSWRVANVNDHSSYQVHGGNYLFVSSYNSSANAENWLISPKIKLGGEISFWVSRHSSYTDYYSVYVSTGTASISDFTNVLATDILPTGSYSQKTYSLENYSGEGYIAIVHTAKTYDQGYIFIDDVTITTPATEAIHHDVCSKVTIDGEKATVNGDVFGGGKMGKTDGPVTVNLFKGLIKGHLFGGAYGAQGSVYVGGQKTVNITGGHVLGNVYGGSRNANDANALTGYDEEEQATTCEINMSAGKVDQNVYGAGYFGSTYGSVNLYLGAEAINSAPNHTTIDETINYSREGGLNIEGTIYAGGDWGTFSGGTFGAPTVSGQSNIYVDGTNYNSTSNSTSAANYMKAGIAIIGSGTSCDAGTTGRTLIVRNYGTALADAGNTANPFSNATRQLYSIQRFKNVIFDNAHLLFTGQGKVNSLSVTEKYGLYEDETVYLSNGSTMVTNEPCSQIKSFQSVTCSNTYADTPSFSAVAINGLGSTGGSTDNKIRVNGGSYIEVKYEADGVTTPYGELKGWAHMMSSTNDEEATCAYARPKQSQETGNIIPDEENNGNDGGFVSYDGLYNQYTAAGAMVETGNSEQIRYENHTPNMRDNSQYFRIWRYGGNHTTIKRVFDAHATGTAGYKTVDVTVTLPPFRSSNHYYRFETVGEAPNQNTTTEYGSDVLTYNAACYNTTLDTDGIHGTPVTNGYMYYSNGQQLTQEIGNCPGKADIDDNPDVNFGLVIMPNTSIVNGTNYIICDASDAYLAGLNKPFQCADADNIQAPEFTFRLTYSNMLSSNMSWDPMKIKLVQCDASGHITDYVTLELSVVTSTTITQDFTTKVYAIMDGHGSLKDTYTAKMILPTYNVQQAGENSTFTITGVSFKPGAYIPANGGTVTNISINNDFDLNSYGLAIEAADTYDNTNVWFSEGGQIDVANNPVNKVIGQESGRNEVGIDITLFYNGNVTVQEESLMGTDTITVKFNNYQGGTAPAYEGTFRIIVEVYRLGQGENFYVDGVNGKDETGYGKNPDKAAKTVNYIFNRCNYRPGGNIFVVNTVTVSNSETWNGQRFNSVNMYRYPGKHKLSTGDNDYGEEGTNLEFTGTLVEVQNDLLMRNIVMDGMYAEAIAATHTTHIYPSDHGCNFDGESEAPLIHVADGGRLSLTEGTALKNNYNGSQAINGGGLCVEYGGIAKMDYAATITGNINAMAGGVYVDGSLIVCDSVKITGNRKGVDASARQSNVWLAEATVEQAKANVHYKVIQIGTATSTDEFAELLEDARIGVDKEDWGHTIDGYMPVVYAEDGTEQEYLELPYQHPQVVIFHDGNKYSLEKYTDEHYLYWLSNWVNKQDHQPTAEEGGWPYNSSTTEFGIDTEYQFAWIISLVNGENNCTADDFTGKKIVINNDIDMSASVWVPITNFKGTLEGNGHQIKGLNSSMVKDNMGMFGLTDGATIQNVVAIANFNADAENLGTIIGTMKNTTLSNVEAGGELEGKTHTKNMGGLVGKVESGTIHSAFAVNDMTAGVNTTVMGGLVGNNAGNLYNSYANTTMTGATKTGGLVGVNDGHVENCYSVMGTQTFPAFANTNNGVITICYADNANGYVTTTGEGSSVTLEGHGNYAATANTHTYGYMYSDNAVELVDGEDENNSYVVDEIVYKKLDPENSESPSINIDKWPGLLSSLNQWVNANSTSSLQYTKWLRPTTKNINDDLPVLCFPKDNCFATTDGKILDYSAFNSSNNGLDHLLLSYQDLSADIFLYGNTIEVANVPTANVNVYINEDVVLKQAASAGEFINAQVGVSFDNSCGTAQDFFGNTLAYDWHMLSTPLANAQLGISYSNDSINPWTMNNQAHQVTGVANSYMPDGTANIGNWDLYSFYEPEYHWINLKRNSASHHHYDEPYDHIVYKNEDFFTAGKGYMTAIDKDTYLCNKGTLNGPSNPVSVNLTKQSHEPGTEELGYNLLGNPYQAYLNMSAFLGANSLSSYWVYIAESNNYIAGNVRASDNPVLPSATLHPHQGFFVLANNDGQTVNFDYSTMALTTPQEHSYFRGDKVNYPLVNLFVAGDRNMKDLAVIEFNRPETGGSKKMRNVNNATFELAAFKDGEPYSILFTEKGESHVPVTFVTHEDGEFTMTWSTLHGQFTQLFLIDNVTGVRTDMLTNDHYTFNGSADETAWRFYIDFHCIDNENDDDDNENDDFFAWFDGNDWIINGKGQIQLVDVLGHVLRSQVVSDEQTRLNLDGCAAGVYVLYLSDGKTAKSQKIVVK